jgi:large subunit ribosomal protein L24
MSIIKKDDMVVVITGDDKGKQGRVLLINPSKGLLKVQGIALVTKHQKARKDGEKSGIRIFERFIHISNVALIKTT